MTKIKEESDFSSMGIFKGKIEQRKDKRLSDSLMVSLQVSNETLNTVCQSKDISQGGMRLRLPQELKLGSTLKVWIELTYATAPVLVIGKVAWQKELEEPGHPVEVGIEFKMMDPAVKEKLRKHIQNIKKPNSKMEAA
jgi:c-di-GMP-binding flagellar brake protein YcgR